MVSLDDKSALLIYRIGPVYCCSPSLPVENVMVPGNLTHPPGTDTAHPGIFKHGRHIVSVSDLRYQFGVKQADWQHPGRLIVTSLEKGYLGFWVDEIIDVIRFPDSGWGNLPAQLPRGVFSRTLLLNKHIHLYAEFEKLQSLQGGGYLRQYIQKLEAEQQQVDKKATQPVVSPSPRTQVTQPAETATAVTMTQKVDKFTDKPESIKTVPEMPSTTVNKPSPGVAQAKPTPPAPQPRQSPQARHDTVKHQVTRPAPITANQPDAHATAPTQQALSASSTAASQSNMHRPATAPASRHTGQTTLDSQTSSSGLWVLLGFILLVILTGGSAYYFLIEQPQPLTRSKPASIKSTQSEQPAPVTTPTEPVVVPDIETRQAESSTSGNLAGIDEPTPQQPEQTSASLPLAESAQGKEKPRYHAAIEQDAQGITIILNAPRSSASREERPDTIDASPNTETDTPRVATKPENETPAPADTVETSQPEPPEAAPRKTEIIHIVVKGDTLWDIAKRYVDDPFLYPELARLSNIKNPHRIYPGNRVRIIRYLD